jgi:hypothetical protein
MGVVVARGKGKTVRGTYLPEQRRRPAHQKGRSNGVGHRTVDLLAAVKRGRRGCGEGIKGRCVLRAVSWWPWRWLLALGERMGDWATQERSAHARVGRLAGGAGRLD